MRPDSLTYLFLIIPAAAVLCRLTPARFRAAMLLACSLACYWWAEGDNLLLIAAVIGFDYIAAHLICRGGMLPRFRRAVAACAAAAGVGLIILYGVGAELAGTHIPLGLGVVCLTGIGYVADCYYGFSKPERSPVDFALTAAFFPKLWAGPIAGHGRMLPQYRLMRMTLAKTGEGAELLIRGLAKKIILGDTVYRLFTELKKTPFLDMTALTVWSMALTLALATYFILSGYCDMARGAGLVFGFEMPENFDHPYSATSIDEFFSRFNITINKFIRRYVYFNLGGAEGGMLSGIFNILLVTILMGLWFGIRISSLIWGVYFAVFVILDRYLLRRFQEQIPTLFRWMFTFFVVLVSFIIPAGGSPDKIMSYLRLMFGMSAAGGIDSKTIYLLSSNYLALLTAVFCATSIPAAVSGFLKRHATHIWETVSAILYAVLLVMTVSMMI